MTAASPTPWLGELGRKGIHLGSALFPLALAFSWVPPHVVRTLLALGLSLAVVIETGRRWSPAIQRWFLGWFGWMLRSHESSHLTGASWILLAMFLAVWLLPLPVAITALWAAVVGDTAAALVGRSVAQLSGHAAGTKTWSGSLACVIASAVGPVWLVGASLGAALLIGVAAAIAERPALRLDDNVRVAFGAGATAWVLFALGRFPL